MTVGETYLCCRWTGRAACLAHLVFQRQRSLWRQHHPQGPARPAKMVAEARRPAWQRQGRPCGRQLPEKVPPGKSVWGCETARAGYGSGGPGVEPRGPLRSRGSRGAEQEARLGQQGAREESGPQLGGTTPLGRPPSQRQARSPKGATESAGPEIQSRGRGRPEVQEEPAA